MDRARTATHLTEANRFGYSLGVACVPPPTRSLTMAVTTTLTPADAARLRTTLRFAARYIGLRVRTLPAPEQARVARLVAARVLLVTSGVADYTLRAEQALAELF